MEADLAGHPRLRGPVYRNTTFGNRNFVRNRSAPRSIDQYLRQLREELAGADAALIQDALYDAEEYLRAEVAAHPDKSESDVLELIASTYGAPDEVASAYRDTEVKVKAAMAIPRKEAHSALGRFFGVFLGPRAYTSLFFLLLRLPIGIIYFVFAVAGLAVSLSLTLGPIIGVLAQAGWFGTGAVEVFSTAQPEWVFDTAFGIPILGLGGVLLLTSVMHLARGIGRLHAMLAKCMVVAGVASDPAETTESAAALAAH